MKTGHKVFRLKRAHIKRAAVLCALAYQNDPEAIGMVPDPAKRKLLLRHISEFALNYGILYGEVYAVSPDIKALTVWLPYEATTITVWRLMRAGLIPLCFKVGLKTVLRIKYFIYHSQAMRKYHVFDKCYLLFLMAVRPVSQKKGYARILLRAMLNRLDTERRPAFLTTYNEKNVIMYKRYGFETVEVCAIPRADLTLWLMVRKFAAS